MSGYKVLTNKLNCRVDTADKGLVAKRAVKVIVGDRTTISQCEDECGGRVLMVSVPAITVNLKELGFTSCTRGRVRT